MNQSAIQKREEMAKVLSLMKQKKSLNEFRSEFGKIRLEKGKKENSMPKQKIKAHQSS